MTPADLPLLLIVDHDEQMCDLLEQGLSPHYRILLAHDGEQGRHFYMQMGERVDAVIANVELPIMGGAALTSWLRGQPNPPPVILIGGGNSHIPAAAREFWRDIPGISWLEKPFSVDQLRGLVEKSVKP